MCFSGVKWQSVPSKRGKNLFAIAESVILIYQVGSKVVRPKSDQPDRRHHHCPCGVADQKLEDSS